MRLKVNNLAYSAAIADRQVLVSPNTNMIQRNLFYLIRLHFWHRSNSSGILEHTKHAVLEIDLKISFRGGEINLISVPEDGETGALRLISGKN